MATDAVGEEFITIVPVGDSRSAVQDPTFVTVLTVGAAAGAAEVIVRRPRGARLGLGLKFEGGSAAAEKVRKLLVQSCAQDSPAANACTPWGKLIPGDEILAIDGVSVPELTRIDCVRRLKDSDENLTLLVRHSESNYGKLEPNMDPTENGNTIKPVDIPRPTTLPPPVPPRKLGKKNSFKDKQTLQTVGEQSAVTNSESHIMNGVNGKDASVNGHINGIASITKLSRKSSFDSHLYRQNKEAIASLRKGSPEEVRRLVRRLSDGKAMPPEAEVYIDLLSSEWERCLLLADAESDDTGSSISTVVDRLGSMAGSVENSIPSTPVMQPKTIDIQKVLNCIENIDSNILKDMTTVKFLEKQEVVQDSTSEKNIVTGYNNRSEEIVVCKKLQQNDKNNNNTIIPNSAPKLESSKNCELKAAAKPEILTEKPKPMPRNTKIERSHSEKKPRPIPVPETPPPPIPEPLLTPTKKNCIETWLQRSEAEMNNSSVEKVEEVPEVLPRLIDFVPKPQFKECGSEPSAVTRPTTAPPPPPAEAREDGSGASLDTIGELDESCDVTDNAKLMAIVNETTATERKPSFDRSFWEDRINKSDVEDKSLSNDESPLPTCPRQPPDGVEAPSDLVEKIPDLPTRLPPPLPRSWPKTRFSYTSRSQDARSEASVKDKIAMFSNDTAPPTESLDKYLTLPSKVAPITRKSTTSYSNYSDISAMDKRLTKSQDNLDDVPRSYKKVLDRPEVLGSVEYSSIDSATGSNSATSLTNKPLFYGSTNILSTSQSVDTYVPPVYHHSRSVSDDSTNSTKSTHKSNLEYLIEQRKKSMSKLRGLVIPEVLGTIVDLPEIKVKDNLKKSYLSNSSDINYNKNETKVKNIQPIILNENKWKANILPNNIPKYSPAFKRKSLQVYSPTILYKEPTPERKFMEKVETIGKLNNNTNTSKILNSTTNIKTGNNNLHSFSTSPSKLTTNYTKITNKDYKDIINNARDYKNVEIKICMATEIVDSDNDSAMSSTQSSYRSSASSPMHTIDTMESDSSRLSPRISNYTSYSTMRLENQIKTTTTTEKTCDEYIKRNVCRSVSSDTNVSLSSSAGSAATSGSQASCSSLESTVADSDKRKVSKTYNVDTMNRRNILASAKCRSGRDAKLKSPVVEAKFSHESCDRSPSPTLKASERLSTLTSSVSAISNKGESRRRNKVIAETDSDSDSEANMRQRKTEYKNTRLKRNSSATNKNKQTETNVVEHTKVEDAPKLISEKNTKEIKKAGLQNYATVIQSTQSTPLEAKKSVLQNYAPIKSQSLMETKKIESKIPKKEFIVNKVPDTKPAPKSEDVVDTSFKSRISSSKRIMPENSDDGKLQTHTVRLQRGLGAGVGLILAGGIDCEAKDVTVHRVLTDSIADKAGLKKGVKVISINGHAMTGLTHAQSVTILKEQRSEVVIEYEDDRRSTRGVSCDSDRTDSRTSKRLEEVKVDKSSSGTTVTVVLEKIGGGAGLGFGLDGGRDSPLGDRPLTVKKLFAGGAAAQSGLIVVGAELLSAGGQPMDGFTRTQAWAALKALPAGQVALVLRNPK